MMVEEQNRKEALLQAVANEYMRKILISTIARSKSIDEIAKENQIPVSTCYRRVHELLSLRLIRVERTVITETGKKFETYRSLVKNATVNFTSSGEFAVDVTLVPREPEERLSTMWNSMRKTEPQIIQVIG
jgi:hypothetical protein